LLAAVFKAIWVDGLNLNDAAVTAQMLAGAGFEPAHMHALTSAADVKDALKATTQEAIDKGVFGAPTMLVGDEMFFGQDRLMQVQEELVRA
jgi:2-hydroxychromene-2-carboxylate isomerase